MMKVWFQVVRKNSLDQRGLSLVEVIFATGIALLLLIALVTGAVISVRNANFARNRSQAEKLARQEIELVRAYRDQQTFAQLDPSLCQTGSTDYCYLTSDLTLQSGSGDVAKEVVGMFKRYFQVASPGDCSVPPGGASEVKEIVITVEWLEGRGTAVGGAGFHTTKLSSCLTNWRSLP